MELELPLKMRLEAIDAQHADTVALLRGPLVLMAVKGEAGRPAAEGDARAVAGGAGA